MIAAVKGLDDAIERRSLRDEAVQRIRAAIVYGEIEPGAIHSAPALAARLGVSITPVREALLELTSRGMVSQVRNRGFRVVERTPADLDAALELRGLVEVPLMRRLAGRLDAADLTHFDTLVTAGLDAARQGELGTFLDLDRRFHLGLLERAGNPRAAEVVDRILDHLRLTLFAQGADTGLLAVAEGHGALLAALRGGDAELVELCVREHLELTRTAWHAQDGVGSSPPAGGTLPATRTI